MARQLGMWITALVAVLATTLGVVPQGATAASAAPSMAPSAAAVTARATAPATVTCGRDGTGRVTSIAVHRPKVAMERRWKRRGWTAQYVTLYLQLQGRNAVTGTWVTFGDHTTRTEVARKGRTRLRAKPFAKLPGQYAAFRVVGTVTWRNPATYNGDRRRHFVSGSCAQPVNVPSWSSVSGAGLPNTAEVICAGAGAYCIAAGYTKPTAASAPFAAIATWTGGGWARYDLASTGTTTNASLLGGGDCYSTASCLVVGRWIPSAGGSTDGLAIRWNGASWTRLPDPPMPAGQNFMMASDAACPTATYCAVAGWYNNAGTSDKNNGGFIDVWDDASWTPFYTYAPFGVTLTSIDCWAQSACLAVGGSAGTSDGAQAVSFAGARAPVVPIPGNSSAAGLNDVSCTAATFCLAVGHNGSHAFAQRWDGSAMHQVAMPSAMVTADTVSCTSATSCVIFGRSSAGSVVAQWNGSTVTQQSGTLGDAGQVQGACWSTPAHCLAANSAGQLAWRR